VHARLEQRILVELLAAVETGRWTDSGRWSAAQVLPVARHHRLSALLSARITAENDPELAEVFRRDRVVTAARNMILGAAGEACLRAFSAAGITAVVLKGLAYESWLYPDEGAGCRPTSDVDLLVPNERRRHAFSVLDGLGFEPRAAAAGFDDPDYHEVDWTRAGTEVDLHLALAPFARCAVDYRDVWSDLQPTKVGTTPALRLAPRHAAVFHALHMAIDHFDVPALYLVDLARMLDSDESLRAAAATARAWRCWRPFATALALAQTFLPGWARQRPLSAAPPYARGIVTGFGDTAPLPRTTQLWRKLAHFDGARDALAYSLVQGRRKLREIVERRLRRRSARERLAVRGDL
jgi:hypothetical protein